MKHTPEPDLALYSTGDLPVWERSRVWLHVRACEQCQTKIAAYQADRRRRRTASDGLPEGLDWERLSAEMTANIHVGLAAGECVAPRSRGVWKRTLPGVGGLGTGAWGFSWRPAAVVAGLVALISAAWWLNMPAADTQSLTRAVSRVAHGVAHGGRRGVLSEEAGPVVEATSAGVELRENGGALQVSQSGQRPLTVSVSMQGSASAHYIDTDTGQVTITSVYEQ